LVGFYQAAAGKCNKTKKNKKAAEFHPNYKNIFDLGVSND